MNAQMERQRGHEEDQGLQSGVVGGEHVEKKSVLKKVKAKAKKIKDSITKHGHGSHQSHDQSHESHDDDDDDEMDDDPELHGAPTHDGVSSTFGGGQAQSGAIRRPTEAASASQSLGYTSETNLPISTGIGVQHALHQPQSNLKDPTGKVYESKEMTSNHPGQAVGMIQHDVITGDANRTTPLAVRHHETNALSRPAHEQEQKYRSFIPEQVGVSKHNGVTFGGSQTQKPAPQSFGYTGGHETNLPISTQGIGMGIEKPAIFDRPTTLEADPHAPGEDNPPENYESKVKDPTGRGGEEIGVTPILRSLDKMKTNNDKITQQTDHVGVCRGTQGLYSGSGSHDQFSPEPMSYDAPQKTSKKVSSATSAVADKAMLAKNELASKLGYGVVDHPEKRTSPLHEDESGKPSSVTEYGKKVASTLQEKLAPVYNKVAGAGGGLLSSEEEAVHSDKGVSAKEYIAEKVSPKEEDKALSEVISGALQMSADKEEEEEKKVEPTGKVTFSAKVIKQLGTGEEKSAEEIGSGGSGPGETVVDMLKDTVTSWLGMGGGTEPSTLVFHDIPKDGNEGFSEHNQQSGQGTDGNPRLQ